MSPDTISTVTDAVLEEVMIWQNRQLDEFYPVIFFDTLRVKIRDGNRVVNKAYSMAVGIDMDGIKHILGLWIADNESTAFSGVRVCRYSQPWHPGYVHRLL